MWGDELLAMSYSCYIDVYDHNASGLHFRIRNGCRQLFKCRCLATPNQGKFCIGAILLSALPTYFIAAGFNSHVELFSVTR